jgi:hypothetical protein
MKEVRKILFHEYDVYEDGRVYSHKTNKFLKHRYKIYVTVDLYINKKPKRYFLHKLLAELFIPNPENKPCANHIDGDKFNYNLNNLEWVTSKENTQHAWKIGLCKPSYFGKNVICNVTGRIFRNVKEAAKELGYNHKSLCNMLNPKFNHKNITNLNYI